jgi:hypothetical protein
MKNEEIIEEIRKQIVYILEWIPTKIPLTNAGCEQVRRLYMECLGDSLGAKSQEITVKIELDSLPLRSCTVTVKGTRSILEELCTPPLTIVGELHGVNIKVEIIGE